ncbi:MAG TPA: hypothetical protein VLC28_15800 [Flavitalea sp.]|nr:hypothetical protein [Flavitalea sp.]
MALSKHEEDDSLNSSQHNQAGNKPADRAFSGNDLDNDAVQQGKEKYIRDAGNIEDVRGNGGEPVEENSRHLTDRSGEEKDEEYINTEERKKDLDQTSGIRDL